MEGRPMRSLLDAKRVTAGLGVLLVLLAACTTQGAKQPGRGRIWRSQPAAAGSTVFPGGIAFSNSTDDIWTVNADGTGPRRLTTNPAHDFDPAWSPDSRRPDDRLPLGARREQRGLRDGVRRLPPAQREPGSAR